MIKKSWSGRTNKRSRVLIFTLNETYLTQSLEEDNKKLPDGGFFVGEMSKLVELELSDTLN